MILTLDIGNTQIYGGVFLGSDLKLQFRKSSRETVSSDEVGIFLRSVMREHSLDPNGVHEVGIATVVPELLYSFSSAIKKYFPQAQAKILQAGTRTGLNIRYKNPSDVGADRIANAIAGAFLYPSQNITVVDLGTATTFCAITNDRDYLGGAILAGLKLSMKALEENTAKLPTVELVRPERGLGQTTTESIQSGLYYGHLGAIREILSRIQNEAFHGKKPFVIGTGGLSRLYENVGIFDKVVTELVLLGIREWLTLNRN